MKLKAGRRMIAIWSLMCLPLLVAKGVANPAPNFVVGFSQIGAESGWRTANTNSIKAEAAKRGINLKFADAQQKQENQIKALRSFMDQGRRRNRVFAGR